MQHLLRPKYPTTATPAPRNYYSDWFHAVECLGFSDHFIGAFASGQVDYDTFARPAEESLRKLCYDLLREAENYYFDTVYSEETIAGDLGQKLAAIRLYLHPNLAGILATPEYLYILEGLPVDLCVTFLLEGMLRLRTSFVDTELRAKPLQALRTSTSEIAKLFTFFDLRNKIVEEQKPEYIVID